LASGADVDILRGDVLAKASLILLHRRAVARCGVVLDKLDLFLFPDGIQRLTGVIPFFTGNLFCHAVAGKAAAGKRQQGVEQLIMRHTALFQASADQRQDRRNVLQPFACFVIGDDAEVFQIERQIVRQLAAVQLQPGFLILAHQIDHRLAAIAGFSMNMLEQQQRGRAARSNTSHHSACLSSRGRPGAAGQTAAAWAHPAQSAKALRHGSPTARHRDTRSAAR
jgi:hypothetical protein